MDHLPMHHLRPLPYLIQIGMVSLTELGLRKLTKNWEKDGAEQENTKRIDTFFFTSLNQSYKTILIYFNHLYNILQT